MTNAEIARKLRDFAEHSCRGESPLYEKICMDIADDPSANPGIQQDFRSGDH
jgi:hypothetical protein